MKTTLEEKVFNAIKEAGLLHRSEKKANVLDKRLVFTSAKTINEIEKALEGIDVSLDADCFSPFCNGILFSIRPKRYIQLRPQNK